MNNEDNKTIKITNSKFRRSWVSIGNNDKKYDESNKKSFFEKYGLATIIAALIVTLIPIIFSINDGHSKNETHKPNITFATSKNMWCGLGLIAVDMGYFEDEGLNVDLKYLDAGRYCLDALVSNSVEFATIVEVNLSYFGYTGNESIIDIASIVSSTSSGIIARKSSGINTPEDLKGKKLAFSPGTTSDIFANRFIEKHDLSADNVNLVKIQPLAMTGAVISGSVDAASTWDPHIYNITKSIGDDAVVFRDGDVYTGYLTVAVRKDWAYKNVETVLAFLRALKKAEVFTINNKEEAQNIIARVINLDIEIVKSTWDAHLMRLALDKEAMLKTINVEGNWINTMEGYKDKVLPNYSKYLDSYFIEKIDK